MTTKSSGTTVWVCVVAVIVASLGMVASSMRLPPYPIWSVIVFDAFVIWAVTTQGRAVLVEA